eukprot:TRINITY_DN11239_c0_g1_i1.p1 TRINITY_DN11239_c0_g1~~TRINITY_DN11239_c0_g1_i1.p1  ORF type:complete len:632 (+),score=125.33 TRINITY_DN11239_c0_g1_i1:71-1966(+)
MGLFGKAKPEEGYGEPPVLPKFNLLSNIHWVRIVDKVSSRGERQRRAAILSSECLVLCKANSFAVKRIVSLAAITKLITQDKPTATELKGPPQEGFVILVKIPTEFDLIICQPKQQKAGFASKQDLIDLTQAITFCKKSRISEDGEAQISPEAPKFPIIRIPTSKRIFAHAMLLKGKGHEYPKQNTFDQLNALFMSHKPLPDGDHQQLLEEVHKLIEDDDGKDKKSEKFEKVDKDKPPQQQPQEEPSETGDKSSAALPAAKPVNDPAGSSSEPNWKHLLKGQQRMSSSYRDLRLVPGSKSTFGADSGPAQNPGNVKELQKSTFGNTVTLKPNEFGHSGEWRGPNTMNYCSLIDDIDGVLCGHPGGRIHEDHWSCCGALNYDSYCGQPNPFLQPDDSKPLDRTEGRKRLSRRNSEFTQGSFLVPDVASETNGSAITVGDAATCQVCVAPFTATNKSRLCKRCGCKTCERCCQHLMRIPGTYGPGRVCTACHQEVAEGGELRRSRASSHMSLRTYSDQQSLEAGSVDSAEDLQAASDAMIAAVVCLVTNATVARKRRKKKKKKDTPQNPYGGYPPYAFYPQTKPLHPSAAYFGQSYLPLWKQSGAEGVGVTKQTSSDKFWSGFMTEWDDAAAL